MMNVLTIIGNKNRGVIMMKFMATLLITWSHLAVMFPEQYRGLITGGAIGDGLFFFCSGFTLFLGRKAGFIDWYKRRINRIYPTIIMWALLSSVAFAWQWSVVDLVIMKTEYWFISCIMVYYAIFYVIRTFFMEHLKWVFGLALIVVTLSSFYVLDMERSMMYAQHSFMRIYYFMFMLLGALVAIMDKVEMKAWKSGALALMSLVVYYACMYLYKQGAWWCQFQMVSLIPLLFSIYYIYLFCNSEAVSSLLERKYIGVVLYFISTITLEVYMVQYALFTDKFNYLWPLNIVVVFLLIFALAYVVKCLSRVFTQTFSDDKFSWRKVFELS